jgi:conjugative transfer pilus assembly protein TraH
MKFSFTHLKNQKALIIALILVISSITNLAFAKGTLGASLSQLGIMSNVNRPGVINDQLGGYMTGGSIHTRNALSDEQLFNIDLPSLSMGCGGINLHFGGLGYINTKKLQSLIKNIGSAAASYGAMLTIKTISPQVADVLSQLEAMARFINSQNINSCQIGAQIAAGIFPKTAASQELACNARQMGSNVVSDYFAARDNCQDEDKSETGKDGYDGILGTEYNLVFEALKKMDNAIPDDRIEDLMSLSGTLISKPNGKGGVELIHKNSLIKDSKLIEAKLYGKTGDKLKLYSCTDKAKCVELGYKEEAMSADATYLNQISKLVDSIANKLKNEAAGAKVELSAEENDLAQTSSVPIISIISLELAMKGHGIALATEEYAELIAFDYLISYLDNMVGEVYKALGNLEYSQMDGEHIKAFKEEIRFIKGYLSTERQDAFERMNTLLSVKQRFIQVQHMVRSNFSEYRSN